MSWAKIENKLINEFDFKNQTDLAYFVLEVAKEADKLDHHPDMSISKCSHLRIELYTHTSNEISNLDLQLADKISNLYNNSL